MKNYFPVVAARRAASASLICAICVICGLSSALEISNSTNTPTTNGAAIYADLTDVVSTTTATCYYGTTDGGTSAAAWAYSTNYADCTNGEITVTVTNLVPATWYFYRWYAADGGTNTNSTAWASTSSNLVTLSRAPTNYPTPGAGVTVVADPTTGLILAPTNLVMPTAPDISNRLTAAEGAITTNAAGILDLSNGLAQANGNITTNAASILALSGRVDNAEGAIETNAASILAISQRVDNAEGAIATNAGNIATNADNFTAHTNNVDNPHGVTPTQIGALAASSNLLDVADADIARSNLGAAAQADLDQIVSQTNQIIVVDGTAYVITNAPASAGDVLVFDPATTTAQFVAQSGGGLTTNDVKNVAPLMTNSTSIGIGKNTTPGTHGIAFNQNANGSTYGIAMGLNANGSTYGISLGRNSFGSDYGVAIGDTAAGNTKGVGIGVNVSAYQYGVALGYAAYGQYYACAIGPYSWATNQSVALGFGVTNTITNTTRVRGDLYLDGGTKIYVRENFNAGEFSELATGGAAAGTYPVFAVPLGGAWTDFEIKASTNNFTDLVYYYKSWTTNQDATRGDTNALCYFTDDHAADVRVWNIKTQTNAISEMLISTNSEVETVYFYPSHDCTIPWSEWMSSTNTALVWSYVRVDDLGFEMNASGTKQHWSPIRPDSWDAALTEP